MRVVLKTITTEVDNDNLSSVDRNRCHHEEHMQGPLGVGGKRPILGAGLPDSGTQRLIASEKRSL